MTHKFIYVPYVCTIPIRLCMYCMCMCYVLVCVLSDKGRGEPGSEASKTLSNEEFVLVQMCVRCCSLTESYVEQELLRLKDKTVKDDQTRKDVR